MDKSAHTSTTDEQFNDNNTNNTNRNLPTVIPRLSLKGTKPDVTVCHDYEQVLDVIGFGKTQWLILIISGLLLMMVINETMGMSIITIASQCDFATSSVDKAIMSAASFIGILCSSYFWGYLSDNWGRKPSLMYSTLLGNLVSFISMFMPNYWTFVFLRFMVGVFIAGASSTTFAFLAEFYTVRHRPVVINYAGMFVGLSMVYIPAVAWLVLSMDWSLSITNLLYFRAWRLLILFNLLPGLIAAVVMSFVPDSPKIFIALGKHEKAVEAMNWIAKRNKGRSLEDLKIRNVCNDTPDVDIDRNLEVKKSVGQILKQMWKDTKPLCMKPHVFNFTIACTVMCGLFLCNSGMGLWYPEIQNRLGSYGSAKQMTICQVIDATKKLKNQNETTSVCDDTITTKSYIDSLTFGLCYTGGYIIIGLIINPLGRKWTIVLSLILAALSGFLLHWIFNPIAIVACFIIFLVLPGLCVSILSGGVVDLVPTHLRGKAVCICLMLGRSGSIIGSNLVGGALESYCNITFAVFYILFVLYSLTSCPYKKW